MSREDVVGAPSTTSPPSLLQCSIVGTTEAEVTQLSVSSLFAVSATHQQYTIRSNYGGDVVEASRRFTEFETLHGVLATTWMDEDATPVLPELFPVSKLYVHTSYELNERKKALQLYLRGVAASLEGAAPPLALLEFLGFAAIAVHPEGPDQPIVDGRDEARGGHVGDNKGSADAAAAAPAATAE